MVLWVDVFSSGSLIKLQPYSSWDWSRITWRLGHSHLLPRLRQMKNWRLIRPLPLFTRLDWASSQHRVFALHFVHEGWLLPEWVFPEAKARAARLFLPQHATSLSFSLAFYSIGQAIVSAQIQPCKGRVSKKWWPCLIYLFLRMFYT